MSRLPAKRYKTLPKYKMVLEGFAKSQALNHELTLRERLWWLAMWHAKPNGHATFQDGEIATVLTVRKPDGNVGPATDRGIRKARNDAVAAGQLHPMSDANCLVLPADTVGNRLSGWDKPCPHCMGSTPEPRTTIARRDFESESIDRDSYRGEMNRQAREVLAERIVPHTGTDRSTDREPEGIPA